MFDPHAACWIMFVSAALFLFPSRILSYSVCLSLFFVIQQPHAEPPRFHSFSVSSEISSIGIEDKKHTVEYKAI